MPGAVLDIEAPGTTLRMASTPAGFTSIVGWRGGVSLAGARGQAVDDHELGPGSERPRPRADRRPRLHPRRRRGVRAALRPRGRARFLERPDRRHRAHRAPGERGDRCHQRHRDQRQPLRPLRLRRRQAHRHGDDVPPQRARGRAAAPRTANVVVERSTAEANGADGFVADRGSEAITLRQISAVGNAGDGVRFNGAPLAEDAGPAGASNVPHRDFRLENSVVRDNRGDGVQATDTEELVIAGNQVIGHNDGIVVTGRSPGAQITGNTVRGAVSAAIAVRERPVRRGGHGQPHRRWRDRPPGPGRPGRRAGQRRHRRHEPRPLGRRRGGRLDRRGELPRGRGRAARSTSSA